MMARGYGKLTAKKVEHLKTRGMHADGGGLYLQVAKGGSKSWLFRYKLYGRTRWHGCQSALNWDPRSASKRDPL